jgi:hypothetical protein
MKTVITILFIVWMIGKAIKSAADKAQMRSQHEQRAKKQRPVSPPAAQTSREEASRREVWERQTSGEITDVQVREGMRSAAKGDISDLQSLFEQAKERKREIEGGPPRPQPQVSRSSRPRMAEPRTARPEPEPDAWIPAAPAEPEPDPWIPSSPPEPRREARREARVERKRVAHPREPARESARESARERTRERAVAEPTKKRREKTAAAPKPKRRRERARRPVRTGLPGTIPLIGRLDKSDIRRGIIIAEILGQPKALRDIDTHVI